MTDRVDINRLLLEMRSLKSQSQAFGGVRQVGQEQMQGPRSEQVNGPRFSDLFPRPLIKSIRCSRRRVRPLTPTCAATPMSTLPMS